MKLGRRLGAASPLIGLLLIAALALVAPVDSAIGLDIHGGEAFHPVFAHPHPDMPAGDDALAAVPPGQPAVQGAHAFEPSSPVAVGEVLPNRPLMGEPVQSGAVLSGITGVLPAGLSSPPPDPPPELD